MFFRKRLTVFSLVIIEIIMFVCLAEVIIAQQLAFPTAEGAGRFATGGRGGVVYEVTNLSDAGVGSLRYGIESVSGARTIVFRVSGTIELTKNLSIKNGNLTIAGQTAPGDGICIKNKKLIVPSTALTSVVTIPSYSVSVDADNVIIRYIRFRPGDEIDNSVGAPLSNIKFENDALWGRYRNNVIIDHCSMTWAVDEASSFYDNSNFTMQWCIIGEALYKSFHPKGNHCYGGIWGGKNATFHHNLIVHNTNRNPRFNGARYTTTPQNEFVDFRNNVIYNWGSNSAHSGESGNHNIVNNYYKYGPATGSSVRNRIVNPWDTSSIFPSKWFVDGNYVEEYPDITLDNWNGGVVSSRHPLDIIRVNAPVINSSVTTQSAPEAFFSVITNAGAILPKRDTVDARIAYEALTGTATNGSTWGGGGKGIIDSPTDVGGWPVLNSTEPPLDTDKDGMPDNWENANGLNPNDPADRNNIRSDGYSQLEAYLNYLTGEMPTNVDDNKINLPREFVLNQNYPNPFNPTTVISYQLSVVSFISLKVYDLLGREVATLVNEVRNAGFYSEHFNASNLPSGIYFARLQAGNFNQTIKLILTK